MSKKPRQKVWLIIKNNSIMLGKIAKYTPDYLFFVIIQGVIEGVLNSAAAVFSYNLLNAIDSGVEFKQAAKMIAVMSAYYLIAHAFIQWYNCIKNPLMQKKLHLRMHEELFVKSISLDLSCFDNPQFYNDFVWAMNESDSRAVSVLASTETLIKRSSSFATLLSVLLSVDPMIVLILVVSSGITLVCDFIRNKIGFQHGREANELWRKKNYINRVYHLADYAKELRIRHADDLLMREYDDNMNKIISTEKRYGKKYFIFEGMAWSGVETITLFVVILYTLKLFGDGKLAVGGFAASIGTVMSVRWTLTDLIRCLTTYAQHSLYIEKYLEFLRIEPKIKNGKTTVPDFESLEFKDISFSYNSSENLNKSDSKNKSNSKKQRSVNTLNHVNLKINAGDKIAIVGYNGAGKTTLIKLIMRFYDPIEGEILYNGVNIKEYDPKSYREKIGTVFQDFKIFATTIAENVMNGEYKDEDKKVVLNALEAADFTKKLNTLDKGIGTHLTREFDETGTNLSGGESQKIAISRVFAKNYPIVIMDEPSSALDPIAEYNLNKSILKHTEGKTVIFISHRLSTTRIADKIYMFDTGRLIEQGSHDELLALNGKYAEMFRVQSERYKNL